MFSAEELAIFKGKAVAPPARRSEPESDLAAQRLPVERINVIFGLGYLINVV